MSNCGETVTSLSCTEDMNGLHSPQCAFCIELLAAGIMKACINKTLKS